MKIKHVLAGLRIFEKYGVEDFEVTLPFDSFNGPCLPKEDISKEDIVTLEANGWEYYESDGDWYFEASTTP